MSDPFAHLPLLSPSERVDILTRRVSALHHKSEAATLWWERGNLKLAIREALFSLNRAKEDLWRGV